MIVFDNADLDSACDAVVDAAWGHHGSVSPLTTFNYSSNKKYTQNILIYYIIVT